MWNNVAYQGLQPILGDWVAGINFIAAAAGAGTLGENDSDFSSSSDSEPGFHGHTDLTRYGTQTSSN